MKKRILFTAAALVCAANLTAQCLGVGSSTSSMSPEEMAAAAKADKVMASTGANTNGMLLAAVALTGIGWTMLDMKRRRMDVTARHSTR